MITGLVLFSLAMLFDVLVVCSLVGLLFERDGGRLAYRPGGVEARTTTVTNDG